MESLNLNSLDLLLSKAEQLRNLLKGAPEVIEYLKLIQAKDESTVIPIQTDVLVRAGQAATILDVDKSMIYKYVDEGLLHPYYTPSSSRMKFWLSEVKAIPQRK